MPLTSAQIVTLACQEAKCPGFTSQGGQFLNSVLQDLCQDYDLENTSALGTFTFSFNSGTGNGSGPYQLPVDYLRTQVIDGKDEFFYTIQGVPYPLIQVTKAEYDWMVQTPGFNSYPYNYATDISQAPPQLFVWPPASGGYPCTLRYFRLMPDIATPETSAVVPWFPNSQILIRGTAGRLMGITGDERQASYLGGGDGEAALKYPLGFETLLNQYLKNKSDREGAVKTVGRDRRRWGRPFDQLKNTKNIGWALAAFLVASFMYMWPGQEARANCTAPCTKAQITTDINTNWPDNTSGAITPALLRSTVLDLVNSYLDVNGTSSFSCPTNQVLTAIATLSSYTCGTIPATLGTQTANTVFAGPSSGAAANPAFRSLVGLDLPTPGASSLGGVQSLTCGSHNWFSALSTLGVFTCSQPAFSDLTGTAPNSQLASMNADTVKCNPTGSSGSPQDCTGAQAGSVLCLPSRSIFTSGTNATYTTPTCNTLLPTRIEFEIVGGGGGGAGSGTSPSVATTGGNSCVGTASTTNCSGSTYVANGGALGSVTGGNFAAGGTSSGCDLGLTGQGGGETLGNTSQTGGIGGASFFGGGGIPGGVGSGPTAQAGQAAAASTGSGGGGASSGGTANSGGGGAAGGYCRKLVTSPASSYFYTVGAAGSAGGAGTSGAAGGAGSSGLVIATAYWQ